MTLQVFFNPDDVRCHWTTGFDITRWWTVSAWSSLLILGCQQSLSQSHLSLDTAECFCEVWRVSKALTLLGCACGCLQQLSVPIPTALPLFSWHCPVQAVGTSGTCLQQGSWAVQNMSPQWLQGSCPCAGGEQKMTWMQGWEGFLLKD